MASKLLSVAAVLTLLATNAGAAEKVLDRTFDVPAGGRLSVDVDGGTVTVSGTDANKVVVRMRAQGSDDRLAKLKWSVDRDAQGVTVVSKREPADKWFDWGSNLQMSVTVEVPRAYNVDLRTSGGNLDVKNLNGTAVGRTSGGSIGVESVRGEVRMRTSGGSVRARAVEGPVELETSGGTIVANEIAGGLRAHTSGGGIRIEQRSGSIDAQTSGGSITIDMAGSNEGIVAKTSGGSITLKIPGTTNAVLNASTSGGRVSSNLPLMNGETTKNSLRGTINSGGPEIFARSSGGSITLVKRD
jgi:DUF4097 and DUF4098 domain-containing protein YvlB